MENKLYDFYQNAVLNGLQCVSFSFKYFDLSGAFTNQIFASEVVNLFENKYDFGSPSSGCSTDTQVRIRRRDRLKENYKNEFDKTKEEVSQQELVDKFCGNQIFLSLATFSNQPKKVFLF